METADGESVPACGKPEIEWDGDKGECKDFEDSDDLAPGDFEMARQQVPMIGAIGPWSYRVRGVDVVMETFIEASSKAKGLDSRFPEAVRELAKNEIAPEPVLSDVEKARFGRDRSMDIQTIIEASKDAKPGDVIVFDDLTGDARAMDQDLAIAGGAKPHEGLVGVKDGPILPKEGPRLVGHIRGNEWVVGPLDAEKALDWVMNIVEPAARYFCESLNQPSLMKGTLEKSLKGRDIGIGIITEADLNMETGVMDVTIEMEQKPPAVFHIPVEIPGKHEHSLWAIASRMEKGPEGEVIQVDTAEEFLELPGIDLASDVLAEYEDRLVEVDGVLVETDMMPGEFKDRVTEGDAEAMIMDAVTRDVGVTIDDLYFGEALKDVRCSDCSCRPQGLVVIWDVDFQMVGKMRPPCLGKKKWLGLNRACRHFINVDD